MVGAKNCISGTSVLKPLTSLSLALMPGVGVVYFLLGSVLGFLALLHSSEVGGKWAFAAHWLALARSLYAHHLFVVMSLLLLASRVWRLGKRCKAVEGLVGNADSMAHSLRIGGVVCAVCGLKIQDWKNGCLKPIVEGVCLKDCSDKPVARSLVGEFDGAVEGEEDNNAGEVGNGEVGNVAALRKNLEEERKQKEAALEELEKERRAAASAADEAMAKIACLQNEKALVEREARQFREMAEQKQMYDRQVIESLQWVITRFGMPGVEPEGSADRSTTYASEDDSEKK